MTVQGDQWAFLEFWHRFQPLHEHFKWFTSHFPYMGDDFVSCCGRGSRGSKVVWLCLAVSIDKQPCFVSDPIQSIHRCSPSAWPSCPRQPPPLCHHGSAWHQWFMLRVGTMVPNRLPVALFSNCHLILLIVSIRAYDTSHIPITSYKLDYTLTVAPPLPLWMSKKYVNTLEVMQIGSSTGGPPGGTCRLRCTDFLQVSIAIA